MANKLNPEKLFQNYFDDNDIINSRLVNFAENCLGRFTAVNSENEYDDVVSELQPAITACRAEMGDVNIGLTRQKGMTLNLDEVVVNFKKAMSDLEGVIAHSLGGFKTAPFLEFYPHGVTEYTKATKVQIEELMTRVKAAATRNETSLGTTLTTQLTGFETAWRTARATQNQQKGKVDDSRNDRNEDRVALESALTYAIHFVGMKFRGDVARCMQFFDFSLLHKVHHQHEEPQPAQ